GREPSRRATSRLTGSLALRLPAPGPRFTLRRPPRGPVSPQVPGEEPGGGVRGVLRDAGVSAHVGVQGLLLGAEGVEQVQQRLPVVALVVPLQEDVQRDGDPAGLLDDHAGYEAPGEETG